MKSRFVLFMMGALALVVVFTFLTWPRAGHPTAVQVEPPPPPALDVTGIDGAGLYDRLCEQCHGLKQATYGPALSALSNIPDEALTLLILKGVPDTNMAPLKEQLTAEQLAALVRFVKEHVLPKSPADQRKLDIGPGAAPTQMSLDLVQVSGGDLVARAMLRDASGAPLPKTRVTFNKVSALGGGLPLATVETREGGLAIYYYPLKPGETVLIEAAYAGEPGRQASVARGEASLPGAASTGPLAVGLIAAAPPVNAAAIIAIVVGSIWLIFGYVISLLVRIAGAGAPPTTMRR